MMYKLGKMLLLVGIVGLMVLAPIMSALAQGTVLADTGFRPQQNGFSFANYGNEAKPVNLTAASMQRIFGNTVCKAVTASGCVLTATAQVWMDKINKDMDGGHCEGMAALSKLIFTGQVRLQDLDPNARTIADLKADNPLVQAEIARWFATQYVPPTATNEIKDQTPSQIVDTLVQQLKQGTGPFTMGIYQPDGKGGHAITPYSVVDMGNGIVRVMVYDNNYPGEERFIEVNKNDNTWKYTGSTNPDEPAATYTGNASSFSLTLTPTAHRTTVPQECIFCTPTPATQAPEEGRASCGQTAVSTGPNTDLVVSTRDGRTAGVVNGHAFSNIAGAIIIQPRSQDFTGDTPGATVIIPNGGEMSVTVNGEGGNDVLVTTCGGYQRVQGMSQADGEPDVLTFAEDASYISGQIDPDEVVHFQGGYDDPLGDDFIYDLPNVTSSNGAVILVRANPLSNQFSFESSSDTTFDAIFSAINLNGERFDHPVMGLSSASNQGINFTLDDTVYGDEESFEIVDVEVEEFEIYIEQSETSEQTFDDLMEQYPDEEDDSQE